MLKFLDGLTNKYIESFKGFYVNKLKNIELAIKVLIIVIIVQGLINILMVNYVIQASIYKDININVNKETLVENTMLNKNNSKATTAETLENLNEQAAEQKATVKKSGWAELLK
jgi:hypothetical protein